MYRAMKIESLKNNNRIYQTGEIYWVKFDGTGHLQRGWHPAIIIQGNIGNYYSPTIVVLPITSKIKKQLPTHVRIKAGYFGLSKDSTVQCEGQRLVNKSQFGGYIGTVDNETMNAIATACLINLPLLQYLDLNECSRIRMQYAT